MENAVSVKAEGGAGRDALIFCLPFLPLRFRELIASAVGEKFNTFFENRSFFIWNKQIPAVEYTE